MKIFPPASDASDSRLKRTLSPLGEHTRPRASRPASEVLGNLDASALRNVGALAPADSDGSWPCQAVRAIFEAVTTDKILWGFDMGIFNQRGITTRSIKAGGEQEREQVKKYRAYAEKCKVAWPRTALALRRIADNYDAHAKWQDELAETRT